MVRYLLWLGLAGLACAQGTEPKPKADDYEVHGRARDLAIGAEYMVHSFSGEGVTFLAPDFLILEVALYPPKGQYVRVASGDFTLRVDGRRTTLPAASADMVAASLRRSEWQRTRGVEATGGIGDTAVVLGAPQQVPPYGNPPRRTPLPPRAPEPENPSGLPRPEPVKPPSW